MSSVFIKKVQFIKIKNQQKRKINLLTLIFIKNNLTNIFLLLKIIHYLIKLKLKLKLCKKPNLLDVNMVLQVLNCIDV